MAYIKQTFVDDETVVTAQHFNHMEDGIANSLPIPASAQVGQYIVVSAVDENGAVMATEAVTMVNASEISF